MYKKITVLGLLLFTMLVLKVTCSAGEMLQTTNFKNGVALPWNLSKSEEMNAYLGFENGDLKVHIEKAGTNIWNVQIRHREISIVKGCEYIVHFKLHVKNACRIYAKIGDSGDPYHDVWSNNFQDFGIPAGETLDVTKSFTADADSKMAEFAFYLGGELAGTLPNDIYFTEMSLFRPDYDPTPVPTPNPSYGISVNQFGYYPVSEKKATLVSDSTSPVSVQLKDSTGRVVWTGYSIPKDIDIASGNKVHIIDFSDFKTIGRGYKLFAGGSVSYDFDIGFGMYSKMKYDALRYFYYSRSGMNIAMPYCEQSKWARPASHLNDIATLYPNRPYSDGIYTGGPTSINGTGGWYTLGGDHGKYVIYGSIPTWMLQNEYENLLKSGNTWAFDDNTMNIPESGNGKPDLLDEARYNVEYFLKVQIPEGFNKAGMVVDRIADERWDYLSLQPSDAIIKRFYNPPSTSSTLNFTAVTAQASRLWKSYDPEFSQRCLVAAETAWKAALKYPDIFNQTNNTNLDDEFYWAACELFVTTGKSEYLDYIKGSEYYCKMPTTINDGDSKGNAGCFDYYNTGGLGTISLALNCPAGLSASEISAAKTGIANAAASFIYLQQKEGYGVPLAVSTYMNEYGGMSETINDGYCFESNLSIINTCFIMAYAYEFTGNVKYYNGASEGMDYLMGRNPLNKCYITGYGENPVRNPCNYLFGNQDVISNSDVPAGILVSGPNSGVQDDYSRAAGLHGLPGQKCYVDSIESWSTNSAECIYNAPLAWMANFLDDSYVVPPYNTPTPLVTIKVDLNDDNAVNMADVMIVAAAFNSRLGDGRYIEACDLNKDGAVNMSDVMLIAAKFGLVY